METFKNSIKWPGIMYIHSQKAADYHGPQIIAETKGKTQEAENQWLNTAEVTLALLQCSSHWSPVKKKSLGNSPRAGLEHTESTLKGGKRKF